MKKSCFQTSSASIISALLFVTLSGCQTYPCASWFYQPPEPPHMLGSGVDQIMRGQEDNAEASKYVVYQHEFKLNKAENLDPLNGLRLNEFGEDHIKRIAENLRRGSHFPVLVERSHTSVRPLTKYQYPVHFQPELDRKRREVVVLALVALGIEDAEKRVIISPALAQSYQSVESERAYQNGLNSNNNNGRRGGSGFGGGGSGFGGGNF